jgi:hypothetical protein
MWQAEETMQRFHFPRVGNQAERTPPQVDSKELKGLQGKIGRESDAETV